MNVGDCIGFRRAGDAAHAHRRVSGWGAACDSRPTRSFVRKAGYQTYWPLFGPQSFHRIDRDSAARGQGGGDESDQHQRKRGSGKDERVFRFPGRAPAGY